MPAVDHAAEALRHLEIAGETLSHTDLLASEDCLSAIADALLGILHVGLAFLDRLDRLPAPPRPGAFLRCRCGATPTAQEITDGGGTCPGCGAKLV